MKCSSVWNSIGKVIFIATISLCGCSSGPTIRSHVDPNADLSKFRTFGFYDPSAAGQYTTLLARHFQDAISREMTARGYSRVDAPDLLINIHLQARDKVQVTQTPATYYGWRRGYRWAGVPYETDVRSYTEGTLNIDVVDRARNELVWEGVVVGRIKEKSLQNPEPAVNAVVTQIFEHYPARVGGSAP